MVRVAYDGMPGPRDGAVTRGERVEDRMGESRVVGNVPVVAASQDDEIPILWEICDITPEWAEEMLLRAKSKRKIPAAEVEKMARDMARGAWPYNAVAIIFDYTGALLDGRRRLTACIQAGVPFRSLVFRNIDPAVWDRINTQRTRKLADVLSILKKTHYRSLGTALKIIHASRQGHLFAERGEPTDLELLQILDGYDVERSIGFANRRGRKVALPLFAALHFLLARVDRASADAFFADLCDPSRLRENDPEKVLHDMLAAAKRGRVKPKREVVAAWIVNGWNARRTGRLDAKLRWDPDKDGRFPEIEGWTEDCNIAVGGLGEDHGQYGNRAVVMPASEDTGGHSLDDEWVELVPEMTVERAQALLLRNTNNRSISQAQVDKYARDMERGDYAFTGETVKVARSGRLLDGQHRLSAVVKSGVGVPMAIAYGLDEIVFETLDRGEHRDFSDVLNERGVQNAGAVAAAVRMLWLLENYRFLYAKGQRPVASNSELDATLADHPEILERTTYINKLRTKLVPSVAILAEYMFSRVDAAMARDFLDRVAMGLGLQAGDPEYTLRERLTVLYAQRRGEPDPVEQLALSVKAWNKRMEGKPLRALTWGKDELKAGFPQVHGPRKGRLRAVEAG